MKRKKLGVFIILLLFFLGVSFGFAADSRKGAISISPSIGGYNFEGNQDFQDDDSFMPTFAAGVGLGYNFTDRWSAEGLFNYINAESDKFHGLADIDTYLYRLNALYHFPLKGGPFVPFISAGLGVINFDVKTPDSDTDFLLNYGAGVKYFFTDNIALRGDVAHIVTLNPNHNNLLYTIGVTYLVGGEKAIPKDSDGDGVMDDNDACPGTPAGVAVDASGCPLDSDKDGVYDYLDKCPGTPLGVVVDKNGCPLDSDGDGILDYLDKCPDKPAPGTVDGCPELVEEVKEEAAAAILETKRMKLNVEFDYDKADVKTKYHDEIGKLADVLKKYPEISVTVEGHTDNRGTDKYNQVLSQKRADNVRKYLIEKFGIEGARVKAKGYGESRPIADNATDAGKQINRRVEAEIEYQVEVTQ
ncbi:MAG: OmpA family protein [Deltaproteobacteria bacterium]|nr:OmpA family protein [Deltaproteobacteria bacterium]